MYKKSYIFAYMFKLWSPSKYSPFDAIHLSRHFFHCSKQFFSSLMLMPFSVSTVCLFVSAFRTFFIQGNQKLLRARSDEQRGWGSCPFWSKTAEYSGGVGRCACKSPTKKWANALKNLQKRFAEAKCSLSQQHQLVL